MMDEPTDTTKNVPPQLLPCEPHRILIADDEKSIRELFATLLRLDLPHCRVDLAVNGAEAVEMFRTIRHCVIVMDLYMPVMDGEQAFHEIQKLCETEKWEMPSVVFCTGYDPSAMIRNMVKTRPEHCILTKPISNTQLVKALQQRMKP